METMRFSKAALLLPLLVFVFSFQAAAGDTAEYQLFPSVLSSGGKPCASASYQLTGTFGQPIAGSVSIASTARILSGFWHMLADLSEGDIKGDVNGDGVVDLKDVVLVLQILTGRDPAVVHMAADVAGDQRIDAREALLILREQALSR